MAGCLFQTVWNYLSGKPPDADILDYDLFHHDPSDTSWGAEDAVIRRSRRVFADLEAEVHAPFGHEDLFAMVVRPNRRRQLPDVYHQEAARWSRAWPGLTVVPWSAVEE